MEPDRVYMYCGGFAPWTVADTGSLRFPSAQMIRDDAGTYGDVARSFDWWMSRICMPDAADFERAVSFATDQPYEEAGSGSGATAADADAGTPSAEREMARRAEAEARFEDCWSSTWYEQDDLAVGAPLYEWLPAPVAISPKLVFCFCAAPYTEDELWPKVVVFANWAKWFACAMAAFFLLTFFMESYLLRFKRQRLEQYLDAAAVWEEGGIVGGIMHISSNNLSRVRSTFNGTKSPVNARTESGRYRSESELIAAANQRNKPPEWNTVLPGVGSSKSPPVGAPPPPDFSADAGSQAEFYPPPFAHGGGSTYL